MSAFAGVLGEQQPVLLFAQAQLAFRSRFHGKNLPCIGHDHVIDLDCALGNLALRLIGKVLAVRSKCCQKN